MTTATRPARQRTQPRRPALDHATAEGLATAEYDRFIAGLRQLAPPAT